MVAPFDVHPAPCPRSEHASRLPDHLRPQANRTRSCETGARSTETGHRAPETGRSTDCPVASSLAVDPVPSCSVARSIENVPPGSLNGDGRRGIRGGLHRSAGCRQLAETGEEAPPPLRVISGGGEVVAVIVWRSRSRLKRQRWPRRSRRRSGGSRAHGRDPAGLG